MLRLSYVPLEVRGVLTVGGSDARAFLQGIVSNDMDKMDARRAIYAALLTPQGKFLHDFIMATLGETYLVDCEAKRLMDLGQRLAAYKLHAQVDLADATEDFRVVALFGDGAARALDLPDRLGAAGPLLGGIAMIDPRRTDLGARAILPRDAALAALEDRGFRPGAAAEYERLRLSLGVPDGSRDMAVGQATLLENDFEALHGVDFNKGCYVGQELTARTKYRGLIRRRLTRVAVEGPLPAPGTPIMLGEKEAGEMRSGLDGVGLALLRLERVEEAATANAPLVAGEARITPL
jgi:folate-binding protein YgfZ